MHGRLLAVCVIGLAGCGPLVAAAAPATALGESSGDGDSSGGRGTAHDDDAGEGHEGAMPSTSAAGTTSEGESSSEGGSSDAVSDGSTGVLEPEPTLVHYRIVVDNTWTEANHPGAFPMDAHFSWLGGATHDASVSFWNVGEFASPGIVQMAEIGATQILMTEVQPAIDDGRADAALEWQQWFCPVGTDVAVCGEDTVEIEVHLDHSRVTLVSMLGPSPDWFVGVSGLDLHPDGAWVEELVVDLRPYDGGTRSDMDFTMNGALQEPPLPVSIITAESGQLVGPDSLGTMTFTRIDEPSS